jgi:hypothetical protein
VICEAETFRNNLPTPCGERANVHLTVVTKRDGQPVHATRHLCDRHAEEAIERQRVNTKRVEFDPDLSRARCADLAHAALYGPNPLAHPYEPPTNTAAPVESWRCMACGKPEDDRYHTHMIHRRTEAAAQARQASAEVVEDPRACLRAVDGARALLVSVPFEGPHGLGEATPRDVGRAGLERERAAERGYVRSLEALADACRGALNEGTGLTGSVTPYLRAVDVARAERLDALKAGR